MSVFLKWSSLNSLFVNRNLFTSYLYRAMSSLKDYVVEHDQTKYEFFVNLGKDKAVLQYEVLDPETVELWHTEVPESLRGKGLAKILAEAAMNYVVQEDKKMSVTCTYLQKYLKDNPNPDYMARVVKP